MAPPEKNLDENLETSIRLENSPELMKEHWLINQLHFLVFVLLDDTLYQRVLKYTIREMTYSSLFLFLFQRTNEFLCQGLYFVLYSFVFSLRLVFIFHS